MSGPLAPLRVVELGSIGPGPFAAMMLADMGADVVRLDRLPDPNAIEYPGAALTRGRRSVAIDLRHPGAATVVLQLVERADVLIEGMRPGVAERLGVGPEPCRERNPRLVYGRMTGFGQDGPLARAPGHDINYIALTGTLDGIGRAGGKPLPPMNLVGDFEGGGMLLAYGIMCAVLEREQSGLGQVIDAAMVDGAALLMIALDNTAVRERWGPRGTNRIDSGAFYYDTYETADGRYMAVGAIEPEYYAALIERLGVADDPALPPQNDSSRWAQGKEVFARAFRTRTRDEWCAVFAGVEACVAPVLAPTEVPAPGPAPRLSRTPASIGIPPPQPGEHTDEALADWGFDPIAIAQLKKERILG
jgi:alpha-methylacyl-CoA racemase